MKLTKAQADLLSQDVPVFLNRFTGEVFISDGQGFTMPVNKATFNAVTLKGFLSRTRYERGVYRYDLTDAGRAALSQATGGDE